MKVLLFLLLLLLFCFGCENTKIAMEDLEEESAVDLETDKKDQPQAEPDAQKDTSEYLFVDVPSSSHLNLRSGPGTDYQIIDKLKRGMELEVIDTKKNLADEIWLQVITGDNKEGWVHSDYLKDEIQEEVDLGVLEYLGMSEEEVLALYGEPDKMLDLQFGSEGYFYLYSDLLVSFVFAGGSELVNNLFIYEGAEIMGIEIGMTLQEIEDVLGKPYGKGYDEFFSNRARPPWYALYLMDEDGNLDNSGVHLYIFFREEAGPSVIGDVQWKSFWQRSD